ncbi:MAG: hypothetical protein COX12_02450 [Candidatus Brennerbacteria bacterium CG23_combo_of_CG06-09_8_20_14_all_44_41]|uniref:PEP-utilising enzyme mobile domain-containing protein n=1 Tax=Candidatus Brennerbacteria bacterium CG_4_8_14_3_um_filter_43_14 TaxID=1974521 RepID=A0A2H9N7A5_9BACT|nr:MAG: hypothetical protein AUJ43_02230 [Parcubacteria group bacterium CG1_02_44_31]PIP50241.1 MAG: hypothetical protein COX12_02450 [Candidatus Brennerbacteria bacterium CG23_combo_of_CG06-09_8_20_14_all_44_41]PIX29292.1 MAG: hypothetical protein COZ64_00375 [Candidatus Brennerbacteria bacterium CG_4_8_14_3_um_filter_43_14]
MPRQKIILKGIRASYGLVEGKVVVIRTIKEFSKMKNGRILVAPITSPPWILVMRKAIAIVTDKGGMLSHPAIVCREFGIPAVVGTQNATRLLKDGMYIIVDGNQGKIYAKRQSSY